VYVRWKRRRLKKANSYNPDPHLLAASLVESRRVDGEPRQRTVAYLGSIGERFIELPWERGRFWRQVGLRLDALDLPQAERGAIEEAVARVVARPTPDEEQEAKREMGERLRTLESVRSRPMR